MEYLVLTGFTLLILGIMLVAAYSKMSSSQKSMDIDSAERAVSRLKEAADFVYLHGHPTKLTVDVYLPPDIERSYSFIENKTINLAIDVRGDHTDVWRSTRGDVGWDLYGSSGMPASAGYYVLIVESTPYDQFGGMINIHE